MIFLLILNNFNNSINNYPLANSEKIYGITPVAASRGSVKSLYYTGFSAVLNPLITPIYREGALLPIVAISLKNTKQAQKL